jgi:hypothetical protein
MPDATAAYARAGRNGGTVRLVSGRIVLEPEEIAGLIRGSRLLDLRADTPPEIRRRWTETALTAMDALCGLAEREGTDAVWDVLAVLSHREVLAFATLMASELADTGFTAGGAPPGPPAPPGSG